MDRKQFLKTAGGVAFVSLVPKTFSKVSSAAIEATSAVPSTITPATTIATSSVTPACILSPSVAEGPFYFNANQVRKDITEGKPGIPVEYRFTLLNTDCTSVTNALVDIWHCDKGGNYSGYAGQPDGTSTIGMTFLGGIQMSDANGEVRFTSIYPGWYPHRLTHLHVKIHLADKVVVTTNLFYPDAMNAEVYAMDPYKTAGPNSTRISQDVELHGDTARFNSLLLSFTKDGTGGYIATYVFEIAAASTSIKNAIASPGASFSLNRNFPNPVHQINTFTFSLAKPAKVKLEIVSSMGRRLQLVTRGNFSSGEHKIAWDRTKIRAKKRTILLQAHGGNQ